MPRIATVDDFRRKHCQTNRPSNVRFIDIHNFCQFTDIGDFATVDHLLPIESTGNVQHNRIVLRFEFLGVGYDDAVAETARLTESRPELDEQEQRAINERLAYIADHIHEQPEVRIKYFVQDKHKSGGAIIEVSGRGKKISATDRTIVMTDGCKIKTSDITNLSTLSIE